MRCGRARLGIFSPRSMYGLACQLHSVPLSKARNGDGRINAPNFQGDTSLDGPSSLAGSYTTSTIGCLYFPISRRACSLVFVDIVFFLSFLSRSRLICLNFKVCRAGRTEINFEAGFYVIDGNQLSSRRVPFPRFGERQRRLITC